MSIYDLTYSTLINNLLPSRHRKDVIKSFLYSFTYPLQYLRDNLFNNYYETASYTYISDTNNLYIPLPYVKYRFSDNKIYESQICKKGYKDYTPYDVLALGGSDEWSLFININSSTTILTDYITIDTNTATIFDIIQVSETQQRIDVNYTGTPTSASTLNLHVTDENGLGFYAFEYFPIQDEQYYTFEDGTLAWRLIQEDCHGLRERLKFNNQKFMLEYLLNSYFQRSGIPAFDKITIKNNQIGNDLWIGLEDDSEYISDDENTTIEIGISDLQLETNNFTIDVPTSIYNKMGVTYCEIGIRNIVDRYNFLGLTYNIQIV